ncbi:MAG TPA: mechanosensitive ion channel family protein [Sphingobacteriaceae bacterium]|nr:mechanosensitive ion channel family protein [Sphingobacteriaceae bacterium]
MTGLPLQEVWQNWVAPENLSNLLAKGGRIVLILVAAHFAIRLLTAAVTRFLAIEAEHEIVAQSRARTLTGLMRSVIRYAVDLVAGLAVLDTIGVPIGPMLAGAGVASLAIGFGAQHLVRDLIAGFFILYEDQFDVGDYIQAAGVEGFVEEMGLRITKIRDLGGQVHIVPNGSLELITNFSQGPLRVSFTVTIPYEEDLEKAVAAIDEALAKVSADVDDIVEPPRVLGVQDLTAGGADLLIWGRVKPGTQWATTRMLRQAVKEALDAVGIAAPYPRQIWLEPPEIVRKEGTDRDAGRT